MAQTLGIMLQVDVSHLTKQINEAIKEINASDKIKKVKLQVDVNTLSSSIRKAVNEINSANKIKNKVNVSASETQLLKSIKTAINNINTNGALNGKVVKLKANLNIDDAVKRVKSQIAGITNSSNNINIGQNVNNPALDKAVANVRKELQAEGEQLKTNNDFLRERATLFTKSGTVRTSTKYGSSSENITLNATNGSLTSVTKSVDNSKIAAEQAKAEAAINRTRNALSALKAEYADTNAAKPIKSDTENFKKLENEYNAIVQLINEFEQADNKNTAQFKVNTESKIADFELMIEKFQRAQYAPTSLRTKDVETSAAIEANRLDEFISKIKASNVPVEQMQSTIDGLKLSLSKITDAGSLTKFLNEFSIAKSEFSALNSKSKALAHELSQVDSITKQITNTLRTLENKGNQGILLKNSSNEKVVAMQKDFADLTEKYTALQSSLKNDTSTENLAIVNKELVVLQKQLQKALTDSNALKTSLGNIKINSDLSKKANVLYSQITEYERLNGKGLGVSNPISGMTFGAELEQLKVAIPNAQDLGALDQLNNKFTILKSNIKTIGKEGNTTLTQIKNSAAKFVKWMTMTLLFTKARMYFNQLFTTVLSLDTALIDLKKTFKGGAEELNDFYFESNKLAKQMGVTTAEIIKQGAAFSRLGYSSNETMKKMAEMSAMFAAISPDMNTEEAQDGLVSIIKAFDIDPEDVLDEVLSKVNVIGNTAATSNGEIVEMLKRSSAAMREANNTFEQSVALATAAVEVTRDAPGTGVAWKTISARLRGLDEETLQVTEDVTELTGKFADLTKTAKTPGGISLFTDESKTTYKSTYQIIKELSEIWDDLTDVETARIGEIIGGKRQLQVVSATIENFEAAEKALDNMANSAGNAEAEMQVVRESAAYALNELKETFTALAQDSVSRDFLKNLIKTGTGLINVLDTLVKTFGALPVVIGAASGAITAFKKKGEGLFGYNSKGNFTIWGAETGNGLKSWFSEKTDPTGQKTQIKAVKEFDSAIKTNQMNLQTYNSVMKSSNDAVKRYGRAVMQGTDQTQAFKTVNKQLKTELKQVGKSAKTAADGTKQLSAGMKALNIASSMLVSMGISWAISKVFELISTTVNWADTYSQKANDAADEAKNIAGQIENVNEELKTTKLKIDELNKLDNPTIIQQEELDKLIATNDELERLQKSLLAQQKDAANKAADSTAEWWKTVYYSGVGEGYKDPGDWFAHFWGRTYGGWKSEIDKTSYRAFLDAIEDYKDLQESIAETEKEMSETADESYFAKLDKQLKKSNEELKEAESIAERNYAIWTAKIGNLNLDIPEQKEIYDKMQTLIQSWEYYSGKVKKDLKEIVDDPNYAVVRKHLVDLWQQGKLTEEEFSKITNEAVSGIEEFKQALADNGYEDFAEILRAINEYFKETENDAGDAAKGIRTFADAIGKLSEKLDDFLEKQESLVEALKKVELGGKLSSEELYKLIEQFPKLANENYLQETADGWKITAQGISAVSKNLTEDEKKNLQEKIKTTQKYLEILGMAKSLAFQKEASYSDPLLDAEYEKAMEEARKIYGVLDIKSDDEIDEAFNDLSDELTGYLFLLNLVDEAFDKHENALEGLKERYEDVESEISDFNKQIKTVDSAIEKLNEGSLLDYEELNELLAIDNTLQYKGSEKGYSVAVETLEEVRKKSYETRNSRIKDIIAIVEAEKTAAEASREEYQKTLADMSKTHLWEEAYKNFLAANAQIEYSCELINRLNGLMQDITYDDKENLSNELQNRIDYYETILSAIEAVQDKYTEAIDNEIDALQESKDALKENNDERQRELDLIEARNNLENAKKRKVMVYSEDSGFKQVADQKAIKEAEEKYRDVITDIQEAEIDKQIDIREKQKEALERQNKDLTEFEDNIEKAKIINQAMQALGLKDESELLNLPTDVREGIVQGLTDTTLKKEQEENKDNKYYKPANLDDVLKSLGATVTAEDLKAMKSEFPTEAVYNAAVKGFSDSLKEFTDKAVQNVTNNNNQVVVSPTYIINDATNPEEISKVVNKDLENLLIRYCNSIK